jgi:hypothetical protein
MSRRNRDAAAAAAASEAGRVLQQQRQDPSPEPEQAPVKVERGERPPTRNEPRNRAMDEIYEADRQRKGFNIEQEADTTKEVTPEVAPEVAPEVKAEAPAPVAAEAVEAVSAPVPETVRVKVDGEEWDAPKAEVDEAGGLVAFQKIKAAERRLEKAKEAATEASKAQAAIIEWAKSLQQQPAPAQPKTPADLLKEKIDTIRWGTPEESAAALQEVLAQQNRPVDPQQLVGHALTAFKQNMAVERFKTEFQDIVSNQLLLKLATQLQNERLTELKGNIPDWDNFYRSIGNEIRSVVGRQNQPPAASAQGNTSLATKEEKKSSIVSLPTASARAELPKEEKPETREEILNRMKKARGIPTG